MWNHNYRKTSKPGQCVVCVSQLRNWEQFSSMIIAKNVKSLYFPMNQTSEWWRAWVLYVFFIIPIFLLSSLICGRSIRFGFGHVLFAYARNRPREPPTKPFKRIQEAKMINISNASVCFLISPKSHALFRYRNRRKKEKKVCTDL